MSHGILGLQIRNLTSSTTILTIYLILTSLFHHHFLFYSNFLKEAKKRMMSEVKEYSDKDRMPLRESRVLNGLLEFQEARESRVFNGLLKFQESKAQIAYL